MTELVFDCVDAKPDRSGASPTMLFRLRIAETTGTRIHAVALRCQLRIEPALRRYSDGEAAALVDLFGGRERWGDTLKPMQLANVGVMIGRFSGSTEVDLAVPFTYDLEVAWGRYFHALDDGEVPLLILFSGTVFAGERGLQVEPVPWHKECTYRLPVQAWDAMMDVYFPGTGWLRLHRDTLDALGRYKSDQALATWDDTLRTLLATAGATP